MSLTSVELNRSDERLNNHYRFGGPTRSHCRQLSGVGGMWPSLPSMVTVGASIRPPRGLTGAYSPGFGGFSPGFTRVGEADLMQIDNSLLRGRIAIDSGDPPVITGSVPDLTNGPWLHPREILFLETSTNLSSPNQV